jgi:FtsH-binding integral membrane protein
MTSLSQDILPRPLPRIAGHNGLVDRYFYLSMSLLAAGLVVWGFSHTIDRHLLHPPAPVPVLLWIHSAVFTGWIAFYILQSALVRTRNVRLHRNLGWFGAGLAATMIPLGFITAVAMGRYNKHLLHFAAADAFLSVPLSDMVAFATLIALAIYWRKKPELHRRLIFLANCALLEAAVTRINPYFFVHSLGYALVDVVILLGVARDLVVDRKVHKVYRVAVPLMIALEILIVYLWRGAPSWWVRLAVSMLG